METAGGEEGRMEEAGGNQAPFSSLWEQVPAGPPLLWAASVLAPLGVPWKGPGSMAPQGMRKGSQAWSEHVSLRGRHLGSHA